LRRKILSHKDLDITEEIENGDILHILGILGKCYDMGYDRLFWDGYDSTIHVYKSKEEPEK
jgi:hypothetical protein